TGREHLGHVGDQPTPYSASDEPRVGLAQPGDGNAMARYVERYVYDLVGNIVSMRHRGGDPTRPGWTREFLYDEPSQLEAGRVNNRLSGTRLGDVVEHCRYEGAAGRHGDITAMAHLPLMRWNFQDLLQATARQVVKDGTPETTWYVYDSGGQRVRKVT